MVSQCWVWAGGTVTVGIVFSQNMDMTVSPDVNSFQLIVDGVPLGLSATGWIGPRLLNVTHGFVGAPMGIVSLQLLVEDPDLRCANQHTVKPYGPFDVPPC